MFSMNRIALPRATGLLKSPGISKRGGLSGFSRNRSTALPPFPHNAPSRVSSGKAYPPSLNGKASSPLEIPEDDVFTLDDSPSTPDELIENRGWVKLRLTAKGQTAFPFGKTWLRDNCQCPKCIHPDTKQRTVDTFSIPQDLSINSFKYQKNTVQLDWSDGHRSYYSSSWLKTHTQKKIERKDHGSPLRFRNFRTYTPGQGQYPKVLYSEVMTTDFGLLEWLEKIYVWGFCFIEGVPVNPESTEELLKRIAFIRNTHYGGFWDFTADLTFKDTAYTTEFLGAHTDNTYFTDPARLQLFHLLSHTNGDGGASLLVDGFQAAKTLNEENPAHARALMTTKHPFHASGNEDVCIQPAEHYPVFKSHSYLRQLYQIRWNNYDRAPKRDWWIDEQDRWYTAAKHFNEILLRPEMEIWTQLEPGTALIFDNWRMLHGRSEFTGKRRMCGGYINNDDYISRYRLAKFGRETVLRHLGDTTRHETNPNSYI